MKLKILGCGDAFGSGGNLNTCFFVESQEIKFLIDCGATALISLKKNHIEPADLDYIFISHLHGDHYGGLPFIILDHLRKPRTETLKIVGPKGIQEKTLKCMELLYPTVWENLRQHLFQFEEYNLGSIFKTNCLTLEVYKVIHSAPSMPHGLRFTLENKIIAFSGDTEWTDQLIPLAKDADVFICECNFYSIESKGHLNYQTITEKLNLLNYKQILLTHLGDDALAHANQFDLPIAQDGLAIEL